MRINLLFFVFFVFGGLSNIQGQTALEYHRTFNSSYQQALQFLKENQATIKKEIMQYNADIHLVIPAVFPETVRFSAMQNHLETLSLQMLYVRFGASYANFSIGRFQMKPSFIEALEEEVKQRNLKNFVFITKFKDTDENKIRQERVERLSDLNWQLRYLACFQTIVSQKFPLSSFSEEKKLRFLAAAYNRGFQNSQTEIERWIYKKAFPYGSSYKGTQYAYTDIAWYFYQNHFSTQTIAK